MQIVIILLLYILGFPLGAFWYLGECLETHEGVDSKKVLVAGLFWPAYGIASLIDLITDWDELTKGD